MKEEIVQQLQRAPNIERRKVTWTRINPKLKSLAEDKELLFGLGFLEKDWTEKVLAKSQKWTYEDNL